MKEDIIGRASEKRLLERLRRSKEPDLLALYGRRRVGKTFLIRNFFGDEAFYFEVTGQKEASLAVQLENFADAFSRQFLGGHRLATPAGWNAALKTLADEIDNRKPRGKVVLFFDELPWLNSPKSGFLRALDYFWNSWGSKKNNLIVVVCGSAASWMIRNILYHRGGLHNRVTAQIRLLPFTISETEKYLQSRRLHLDRKQVLELYMCLGGVPHYLRQVEAGQSAAQNIDRICFTKDGFLAGEFDRLYASLFDFSENYIRVVTALAKKRSGLNRKELLAATGAESGGGATVILEALEESGFISRSIPFGKKVNEALYQLVDEYSLFYLTWIRKAPRSAFGLAPAGYWLQERSSRAWNAWAGYAFERICLKHVSMLKQGLGISGISTTEAGWYHRPAGKEERGTQIDLLIDRSDNCISLCEMKYSDTEFVINRSHAAALRNKRDVFKSRTRTKKTIFIVMITTHGTKENRYYEELVSRQLTMDTLFGS